MEGNVSGYVCNHGSPNGERDTASPRLWAMLRMQASDEEADDVFSRRHLYCGTPVVMSWAVAGQQVVFLHMYLQTPETFLLLFHLLIFVKYMYDTITGTHLVSILCHY